MNKDELIYLATPYTHSNEDVMEERFNAVTRVAAKMMSEGRYVFCPITHCHPIARIAKLPVEWEFWEGYDKKMIRFCDKLIVVKLDGWETSVGVTAEVKIAKDFGIPVEYMDPI